VGRLSLPVPQSSLAELRNRLAPSVGEALLGQVYAVSNTAADGAQFTPDLVRKHDFGASPWSATQVDASGRISGNVVRLSQALARLAATSTVFGEPVAPRSTFVEATLNSFHVAGRRWVTRDAEEFVARTIDLGEDVLALARFGDQAANDALNQVDRFMLQRRAIAVKTLVGAGDIMKAIHTLSLSELYAIGRYYLNLRLAKVPLTDLTREPGAIGALATAIVRRQSSETADEVPLTLRREISQFGMTAIATTGLSRIELMEPEPYEQGMGFREDYRLAERILDLKLALARRAHRLGGGALFPLDPTIAQVVLRDTLTETRKATSGTPPPQRDWQSLMLAIQLLDKQDLTQLVNQIAKPSYVRPATRRKWNDPRASSGTDNSSLKP
jgi:hypothetical protein